MWNYEAGVKGLLFGNKLQYDFAAYYYDWNHFQTTVASINNATLVETKDAGKAKSFGIETGLRYAFSNRYTVFANYGFIDAALKIRTKMDKSNSMRAIPPG